MSSVNPPPIPRMPKEWFSNLDIKAYQEAINKIIYQLWVNSPSGTIGDGFVGIDTSSIIGALYSNLNDELDSIYSHSVSSDYTTIGTEIVRATTALTVTLNSEPDDGEVAIIYHDGTTGDALLVTDGSNTDTIKVKNSVICYVYYVDLGKWVP